MGPIVNKASLLLAGACILGGSYLAYAHGAASWIMADPNYKSSLLWPGEFDSHCCGPADCEPYPVQNVKLGPHGYELPETGEIIPYDRAYSTPGSVIQQTGFEYWRCRFVPPSWATDKQGKSLDNRTRCFFAPGGGV